MNDLTDHILSEWARAEFGSVSQTAGAKAFCREWNTDIISFCKTLPNSTQTDALLFFMQQSGMAFNGSIDFFRTYYTPTWSIIFWLSQLSPSNRKPAEADIRIDHGDLTALLYIQGYRQSEFVTGDA